jgi:hypothetical protein
VEEAAKKNRQLVAIGSKFAPFSGSANFRVILPTLVSLMLVVLL